MRTLNKDQPALWSGLKWSSGDYWKLVAPLLFQFCTVTGLKFPVAQPATCSAKHGEESDSDPRVTLKATRYGPFLHGRDEDGTGRDGMLLINNDRDGGGGRGQRPPWSAEAKWNSDAEGRAALPSTEIQSGLVERVNERPTLHVTACFWRH